jgi:hypothetical protein
MFVMQSSCGILAVGGRDAFCHREVTFFSFFDIETQQFGFLIRIISSILTHPNQRRSRVRRHCYSSFFERARFDAMDKSCTAGGRQTGERV